MKIGKGSFISPKASIYSPENLEVGDNVRIDDFCILSCGGGLKIGDHVHIAAYSVMFAGYGIELADFSEFAVRTTILSATDDFFGFSLVGPQIPEQFKPGLKKGKVTIERHALLGANCTVMPGVTIGEGVSVGAYSLVKSDLFPWGIYGGVPATFIRQRSNTMIKLEREFLQWRKASIK